MGLGLVAEPAVAGRFIRPGQRFTAGGRLRDGTGRVDSEHTRGWHLDLYRRVFCAHAATGISGPGSGSGARLVIGNGPDGQADQQAFCSAIGLKQMLEAAESFDDLFDLFAAMGSADAAADVAVLIR